MSRQAIAVGLVACHAAPAANVSSEPTPTASAVMVDAAPSAPIVTTLTTSNGSAPLVWRVLRHVYIENDAGVPIEVSTTLQLEVAGKIFGPYTMGSPGCTTTGTGPGGVVAGVSCYYAGGGEYIEVREKHKGDFVVVGYGQSEQNMGDPPMPRVDLRTLGTFHVDAADLEERMISADGGRYSY